MGIDPIQYTAEHEDQSKRFLESHAVVASPAAAAETIIATVTVAEAEALFSGVRLRGWAAFTVGANGTAVRLRLRRTDVAGTVVADTGAVTAGIAAAALGALTVQGSDAGATLPGQVYVLTMQVTAGTTPSTVSAVSLEAVAV